MDGYECIRFEGECLFHFHFQILSLVFFPAEDDPQGGVGVEVADLSGNGECDVFFREFSIFRPYAGIIPSVSGIYDDRDGLRSPCFACDHSGIPAFRFQGKGRYDHEQQGKCEYACQVVRAWIIRT